MEMSKNMLSKIIVKRFKKRKETGQRIFGGVQLSCDDESFLVLRLILRHRLLNLLGSIEQRLDDDNLAKRTNVAQPPVIKATY